MKKIRIGAIGMGGRLHSVYQCLKNATDQVELVAICDPCEKSVQKAKDSFNQNAVIYSDYKELLKNPDIDWIMIGSWNCFHKEQTIAAFAAGKNVFCEKPLATNLEDCTQMLKAWKQSGKSFVIGFTLRYSPHYRKIKEIVDSGVLGQIISMEFNETLHFDHGGYIHGDWRRKTEYAGTHLLEKCCHDIDLVNWIIGSRAKRVASFGGCNFFTPQNVGEIERIGKNKDGKDAFRTWPGLVSENPFTADKDIVDNQVAIIEYENGVRSTFHTNCSTVIHERRMYLCGSHGTLRADLSKGTIEYQELGYDTKLVDAKTSAKGGHGGGDEILGKSLAANMLDGTPPVSTLEDGVASAVTAFGIDDAMASGQVIDMAPYWSRIEQAASIQPACSC